MFLQKGNDTDHTSKCIETPRFVGKYVKYPNQTGQRIAEGGLRIKGVFKQSLSELPLITVITVCFNSAETLEQTIKSVLNQSYDNIDYVIVDGASSDNTLDIIQKYEDQIDYYISEPDQGIYYAMNKGLELSQGDFILILNSDDWYTPRCVEKLVQAHKTSGVDFVSARANYVTEDGVFIRVQSSSPYDAGVDFRMPLRHETVLMPAEIYEREGGYDTSYRIIADRVKTAKLFWRGYTHFELQDPLLNFRISGVSSTHLDHLYDERRRILTERFPGMPPADTDSLMMLEQLTPERLCEIARRYKSAEFRACAVAYGKSMKKQGHPYWRVFNIVAFEPAIISVFVTDLPDMADTLIDHVPKVSVILPVYNAEVCLAECLDSILSQTLQDFEIICLNDHTPDNSQQIIDTYVARDPRIRSMINEVNIGLGATRNRGIAAARGDYIFHIDPDDTIPPDALKELYDHAVRYGSEMTRGAFMHEQLLLGQKSKAVRKGMLEPGCSHIINSSLANTPELLRSTEGHWSYLYKTDFSRRVFYPENLKMGQDSIFLVNALARVRTVSVIDTVIYNYRANSESAMNTYTVQKFMDEIEWRRRAWHVLDEIGQREIGDHLLFNYWNVPFFDALEKITSSEQYREFFQKLRSAFYEAGSPDAARTKNPRFREIFQSNLRKYASAHLEVECVTPKVFSERLRIEILSTFDSDGAGLSSQRCMAVLRNGGHDVRTLCVFKKSTHSLTRRVPMIEEANAAPNDEILRQVWRKRAVLTHKELPTLRARELFSKVSSIVRFEALMDVIDQADIVHLHWIVGMLDYPAMSEILGDKPVLWTLHDMNPFTGGCHYSEGCTEYQSECRNCPLLGGSDLAHEIWKTKRDAYSGLNNLHIVCPSKWLANCAKKSALFKNRAVHMIPNAIPVEHFKPTNKIVARLRLGLPLDARLVVFGASSLNNRRKGGDILSETVKILAANGQAENMRGLFFGEANLDIGIPVHNMGFVSDPAKLSLIYAAADAYAFPSREDNAPQTVPEALLSGTPVVAFPVGNVPDLVTHLNTGFIARYEDAAHFAEGLAWALKDPPFSHEALVRGLDAHIKARAYHDPQITADGYVDVFRRMLDVIK